MLERDARIVVADGLAGTLTTGVERAADASGRAPGAILTSSFFRKALKMQMKNISTQGRRRPDGRTSAALQNRALCATPTGKQAPLPVIQPLLRCVLTAIS